MMSRNDWLPLTPKAWAKRRRREDGQPIKPPLNKYEIFRRQLDPASPAADALRALRKKLTAKPDLEG
jgi:hypothetical protein